MSRLYSVQCTQTHKHTVESRAVFCLSRISDFNICFVNVSFVKILEFSYCFSCLKDLSGAKSVFGLKSNPASTAAKAKDFPQTF